MKNVMLLVLFLGLSNFARAAEFQLNIQVLNHEEFRKSISQEVLLVEGTETDGYVTEISYLEPSSKKTRTVKIETNVTSEANQAFVTLKTSNGSIIKISAEADRPNDVSLDRTVFVKVTPKSN